jgi:anti-anti-sigma factor
MEIEVKAMKRCELVLLSGEIDSSTAPEVEQELLGLIEVGKKNLVVNFRGVTFISSAGLRALVAAQIRARRKVPQGRVVLSELSPTLMETMSLVGFHHIFEFYDTDTAAVGSF